MADKHTKLTAGLLEEGVKVSDPVKIQDLTFRDAHQSIFATRGRTEDMIPIAEKMDEVGFWALGVWGGATFDTMHRFLGEDPWERPRTLKKYVKNTPLQMLLRGQNLVGYRNYADDVANVYAFIRCLGRETLVVVLNNDGRPYEACIPVGTELAEGTRLIDLLNGGRYEVAHGVLRGSAIARQSGIVLEKMG